MKKIVSIVLLLLIVLGCKREEEVSSGPMQLVAIMRADFGSIPNSSIPKGWDEVLAKSQWIKGNDGLYEKTITLDTINVIINGQKLRTDENGFLPANLGIKRVSDVIIDYMGDNSNMDFIPTKIVGNRIILENTLDEWLAAGDDPHEGHNHGRILGPGPMDDPRCLDYNGTFGNGTNYPKSDYRALLAFPWSDCDYAMGIGFCYLDHLRGGCTKNNGIKCSAYIGHPLYFHVH